MELGPLPGFLLKKIRVIYLEMIKQDKTTFLQILTVFKTRI